MDEVKADHILEVGFGFWPSKTLLSTVEMEVFTELAPNTRRISKPCRVASGSIRDRHEISSMLS